jgi:three-Cys-motif partner protein
LSDQFFEEQAQQSQIKAEIVTKYFVRWAKVMIAAQKRFDKEDRVAYIDLFAGPGRYKDGALSTPVMILENAVKDPDLRERLVAVFNDKDESNSDSLREAIAAVPGIETLKHKPKVRTSEVGEEIVKDFESSRLIPSFLFVDPFGYKGLSLRLVNSVLKDWGCDCVFFFNYNRISMGVSNASVQPHMEALFGKERAELLRDKFNATALKPMEREAFIVNEMSNALKELGGEFVLPFRFRNPEGTRTTHHLFFVSKHFRGYEIMREIMFDHSKKEMRVAKFEYNPADARWPSLFDLLRPLEDLEELLLKDLAGRTIAMKDLYESHSVGKPYVLNNYREVLCRMEQEGKVTMDRPCPPRRKNTLAPDVKVTFPRR